MKNMGILSISFVLFVLNFILIFNNYATNTNVEGAKAEFIPNSALTLQPIILQEEISIDGAFDSCWYKTADFGNFTEFEPVENKKPNAITNGYLAYDSENLYILFICQDPDISQLRASLTDRDNIYDDDWVCVSIDPDKDHQKAYEFYVNARGIQGDKLWQANGTEDESFDMVWKADARIYDDQWIAELKIPFESIRFPNGTEQNWSVHFIRHYPRDNPYKFSWMPISLNNNSFMGQAGNLQFSLPEVQSENRKLEILPYAISSKDGYRIENENDGKLDSWHYNQTEARAGFGFKYGISSNLTADFTFNPDFSQIESDAGQVNINNPFALFYNEKRPFFQEGSDIYVIDYNSNGIAIDQFVNLFYSRSINDPLMAGKISGRYGNISLGFTSAYDRSTPYIIPFEERSAVLLTDNNSYSNIVRAKYDLGNQSAIGFMLTDRRLETSGSNTATAVDASFRISEQYHFSAIAALTYTKEPVDPQASQMLGKGTFKIGNQVKTAAFDGESFYGKLLRAKLNRNSRHWVATLAYQDFSPGFRADNGFVHTNSYRAIEYVGGYFFRFDENRLFTFIRPRFSIWRKFNYDGVVKDTGLRTSIIFSFQRQTIVQLSAFIFNRENLYGKQFDDARLVWLYVENRTLKSLIGTFFVNIGKQINRLGVVGDPHNPFELVPSLNYNMALTFKPAPRLANTLEFQDFYLWKQYGVDKIRGQRILRNSFSYQFNRRMHLRLIAEYNLVDYYNSGISELVRQKYFTLDPLFSYKLNAFSVFYLGSHIGASNNFYFDREELIMNQQSVFIKFQYLFRL
jgi:hypothetical protein